MGGASECDLSIWLCAGGCAAVLSASMLGVRNGTVRWPSAILQYNHELSTGSRKEGVSLLEVSVCKTGQHTRRSALSYVCTCNKP